MTPIIMIWIPPRKNMPTPRKAQPGTEIEIDVRGKVRTAEVRAKPLYSKES